MPGPDGRSERMISADVEICSPQPRDVLRIKLINMPFADWNRPSFALGQLASKARRDLGSRVSVNVCYVNQDIATLFGARIYESLCTSHEHVDTGIGEWLFRQIAFPETEDNSDAYFRRFYPGAAWASFRTEITERRRRLPQVCEELIDRYSLADADIVGFTSMFAQHMASIAVARLVKARSPETLVTFGGANCEAPMGAVIAELVPCVDFVFSGPALETFTEFTRCVLDGNPQAADAIPGIVSRRNYRDARARESIGRDHDIDDVCPPDFDSFLGAVDDHPELQETGESEPMLYFETSRGCWWGERSHCTFCGLNGQSMGYRAMSPDLAIEQFNQLFSLADRCGALFCTDNVMPRSYPAKVFERLDTPPGVSIFYEVKLPLSHQDMRRMAAAGVTKVQPGIEALATSTLKLMAKGTTAFQNLQFLKNCVGYGIDPAWNLLIGFPGEDPAVYERYARDIPRLMHLAPPTGVHMVRFDRFSPYHDRRDEYGLDLHPMDYYELAYPFDPRSLDQLAYFFADHNLAPYMLSAIEWHGRLSQLVGAWQAAWVDGAPRRVLRLEGSEADGWHIRDSRSGALAVHNADGPMSFLIRKLASPLRPAQLAADWPGTPSDLERRLGWLSDQRMLFEEDGRLLSLVLAETDADASEDGGPGDRELLAVSPARGR